VFISPAKYVQGKDALLNSKTHLEALGEAPLLLCDDVVYDIVGKKFHDYLNENGFNVTRELFNGEASTSEIERISERVTTEECDFVIALGGGKTIDTGKAVADEATVSVAVLPTIASTDAPTSALSVIYSDEGTFEKYIFYNKNPDLVLVDTVVVANRAKVVTESLEDVVEANTRLSGLGLESGGLAAAHAIHNGFTALDGKIHELTHGEKVAYGTLTQLILENRDIDEINNYVSLYQT